jgi:hypothetical protein
MVDTMVDTDHINFHIVNPLSVITKVQYAMGKTVENVILLLSLGRAGYEFLVCVQNEKRKEKKVTVNSLNRRHLAEKKETKTLPDFDN